MAPEAEPGTCPECGRRLSAQPWARGGCLACLAELGLDDTLSRWDESTGDASPTPSAASGSETRQTLSWLAPKHLRQVRFWWLYGFACALFLYALGCSIYWLATVGDSVTAGFTYLPRLLVRVVETEPAREAGVEPFDRVLAVGGEPVLDARELAAALRAAGPGGDVEIELERADTGRFSVRLPTERDSSTLMSWLILLRGAVWVTSGLLLFWFHPGRRESWAFLAATLTVGLPALLPVPDFLGGDYLPLHPLLGRGWSIGLEGLIAPACLVFFLVFPYPPRFLARRSWVLPLLFVPALVWAAIFLPTYPWYPDHTGWEQAADATYRILAGFTPLAVLASIAILIWRHRQPRPPKQAAQLRALSVASAFSFPLPALTYAALTVYPEVLTSHLHELVMLSLNLPLFLFPPIVAYAIARHDLFEIDRLTARAGSYALAVLVVGLAYGGAVLLVPNVLAPEALASSPTLMALVILASIAALRPLKAFLLLRVERAWGGHPADPEDKVRGLRDGLRLLSGTDRSEALSHLARLVEQSFGLERVQFLEPVGDGWRPMTAAAASPDAAPGTSRRSPSELELERVLPLRVGEEVVGGMGIGRPTSGGHLSSADEEALALLARDAGQALRRSEAGEEIGGYRVVRLLASGGMGSVYLARRRRAGGFTKEVALKELLPEKAADVDMVRRFLTEARVAARLHHPNIVQTYDLGETEHGYFIAMEYVPGMDTGSLLRRLNRQRALLPIPCALHIVTGICLALDSAHTARDDDGNPLGLVHRDVSPRNVLLSETGEVKLVDFGVAQLTYGQARSGQLVGKVPYMAPEQLRGEPTDHRVDIFATGVLLYELCVGTHPFRQTSKRRTWEAILSGTFLSPETLRSSIPLELSRVVQRALEPSPANRFPNAAEMAEALQSVAPPDLRTPRTLGGIVRRFAGQERESNTSSTLGSRTHEAKTLGPEHS